MRASGNNKRGARVGISWSFSVLLLLAALFPPVQAAGPGGEHRVQDLYYGQALYHYFQQQELEAITELMVAAERPQRPGVQADESNLLLADLFYNYGLYEESRSMFAQLLSAEVSDSIQNRIWFNLARLRYEQGYYEQARDLLSRIDNRLPASIEAERIYLLSSLYLADKQYRQAAELSERIDPGSIWKTYARYNVAVALVEGQDPKGGERILESLGQSQPVDEEQRSLRDLANLTLGLKLLRLGQAEAALQSLSRIRLEGPLSNQALLATGWAWYALEHFDKALVPWQVLLKRNATDAATQEAILAIPASFAESGKDKLAIRYYEIAATQFERQIESLQGAIQSIDQGELIGALRDSAILQDRGNLQRLPPISKVTPQLHLLMASNEFHRQIRRYQELLDIRRSLGHWGNSFPALALMLEQRRLAFSEKLPMLQQSSSFDQFEQLSQRRDAYAQRVAAIIADEDYRALARTEEADHFERMQQVSESIDKLGSERDTAEQQEMLRMLSGLLDYRLATEYPVRIWQARKQLVQLDEALDEARQRVESLGRITEHTGLDFNGFEARIEGQSARIEALRERVDGLLLQQERHINQLGIEAIEAQQLHIAQLRLNARFELARIYDKLAAPQ